MMDNINKTVYFVELLSIYRKLLSITQQEILSSYYEYNLSISEIAENNKVSRSAVEDAIKKGNAKLSNLEKELRIAEKNHKLLNIIDKLKNDNNCSKKELIKDIEGITKDGI